MTEEDALEHAEVWRKVADLASQEMYQAQGMGQMHRAARFTDYMNFAGNVMCEYQFVASQKTQPDQEV